MTAQGPELRALADTLRRVVATTPPGTDRLALSLSPQQTVAMISALERAAAAEGDADRAHRVEQHGEWIKGDERYADGCRSDAPDHYSAEGVAGYCTCDGSNVRVNASCGVREHRDSARALLAEGEKAEVDKETFPWAEHPRSCAASSPGYWKWQGDLRVLKVPCTCAVGTASS